MVMIYHRALLPPLPDGFNPSGWPVPVLPRVRIFDLPLVSATKEQAIQSMLTMARCRVAFVNAHCVNVAHGDPTYRESLQTADLLLPDGVGVEFAARWHDKRLVANLNGTDFCPLLAAELARRGLSLFLLGGRPGIAEKAGQALVRQLPHLRIAGTLDGYCGAREETAIPRINDSGAHVLWVAMGVPLQETWLARNQNQLSPRLVMGVGALFDFLSGRIPRAPVWVRDARMEWAWRLAMEPRRMFHRYVVGNALFVARTIQNDRTHPQSERI